MKTRLDQLLVEKGIFPSRTRAQAAILEGIIFVNGERVDKAGAFFSPETAIEIRGEPLPYVSRGGIKLAKALEEFQIEVKGRVVLDIGASTGGFTDCLLQQGAAQVYAIDVGYGQLAWKLRQDPRVVVVERQNVRYLTPEVLYKDQPKANLAVIDVSFISLAKVLPAVYTLLAAPAEVVALIKPQFEAEREQVGKGGLVKNEQVHQAVVAKVQQAASENGFTVKNLIPSPITGADGNKEFLIHLII